MTPLGFVQLYNSPKPYCSPSIIIQGNFHLSKYPRERFDTFKFDTVLYQFLETGTSDRTLMGLDQLLKCLGFSLYPL